MARDRTCCFYYYKFVHAVFFNVYREYGVKTFPSIIMFVRKVPELFQGEQHTSVILYPSLSLRMRVI
jgi:hypothetical protein